MLNINTKLVSGKNNLKQQKQQSFGMNPINQTRRIASSTNIYLPSNLPRLSNNVQNSINNQTNTDSLNLSQNCSNIELVDIIVEQSQKIDTKKTKTKNKNMYAWMDKEADAYFDEKAGTCAKIGACIPFIGGFVMLFSDLKRRRTKGLDSIYGVPQYIETPKPKTWPHNVLNLLSFLHFTVIGSVIATPLTICTINCLDNIQKQSLKESYREASKLEKETKKQETEDETILRHAEAEADYWEKVAKSNISTIEKALQY